MPTGSERDARILLRCCHHFFFKGTIERHQRQIADPMRPPTTSGGASKNPSSLWVCFCCSSHIFLRQSTSFQLHHQSGSYWWDVVGGQHRDFFCPTLPRVSSWSAGFGNRLWLSVECTFTKQSLPPQCKCVLWIVEISVWWRCDGDETERRDYDSDIAADYGERGERRGERRGGERRAERMQQNRRTQQVRAVLFAVPNQEQKNAFHVHFSKYCAVLGVRCTLVVHQQRAERQHTSSLCA